MACNLFRASLVSARRSSCRTLWGVPAGRASKSGSRSSTRARMSEVVGPSEGTAARDHLVEHATKRPHVGPQVHARTRRACSGLMYAGVPITPVTLMIDSVRPSAEVAPSGSNIFASPKSSTFTVPSNRTIKDVRRLQVAMNDAMSVRGFECFGCRPGNLQWPVSRAGHVHRPRGRRLCALRRAPSRVRGHREQFPHRTASRCLDG